MQDELDTSNNLTAADKTRIEARLAQAQATIASYDAEAEAARRAATAKEAEAEAQESSADAAQNFASMLAGSIGIIEDWRNTTAGSFISAMQGGASFIDVTADLMEAMASAFSPMNLLVSVLEKFVEATIALATEQDAALASFNKATGAAGAFNDEIIAVEREMFRYGVTTDEAAAATQALYFEVASFTELAAEQRQSLVELTSVLQELGVDAADSGRLFEFFTKGMRMSGDEAETQLRLAASRADALKIPMQAFIAGMNNAMKSIGMFGERAADVYTDVAALGKQLGIQTEELLGLFKQYDTFEGAAKAAGHLNAILGGMHVNVMELVHADPADKFRILRQAMEGSGRAFDDMSRREKEALAMAAGIDDMAVAAKIFGAESEAFEQDLELMQQRALEQEKLNEMAREAQTVFDKMKQVMYALALSIRPLVEVIGFVLEVIADFVEGIKFLIFDAPVLSGLIKGLAAAVVLMYTVSRIGLMINFLYTASWASLGTAITGSRIATTLASAATAIWTTISTIAAGATNALAIGFAFLGIGSALTAAKLVLLAAAIALIGYFIMASIHSPPLYIGIFILAAGMYALAAAVSAMTAAAPGAAILFAIGAAVALIGLGIAVVIAAMSLLIDSLGGLFTLVVDNFMTWIGFIASFAILGIGLALIGMFAPLAFMGLMLVAIGLAAMALALFFVSTDDLANLAIFFSSLAEMDTGIAGSILSIASAIKVLADAASDLSFFTIMGVVILTEQFAGLAEDLDAGGAKEYFHDISKLIDTSVKITPEVVDNVTGLVDQAVRYRDDVAEEGMTDFGMWFVKVLKELFAIGGGNENKKETAGKTKGQDIVLVLNERELGRAVEAVLKKRHTLRTKS
tara:strand:- start:2430 stop:5021 length:2592 start_codon:yes stop_codon:yes gene_type:complete